MRKNRLLLLLALLMTAATGAWAAEVTVTKTVHDLFPDVTNGTQKATLYSDDNLSISVNTDGNNGKVYSNGTEWRIYQTNSAVVTVTATDVTIKSVAFTFAVKNTGVIKYDGNAMTSGTAVNVNAASAQFVLGNSGAATNGQVIISGFTVVYETASSGGSGAGYTVSLKDDVKDAEKWTVKVGEGQAQALPIGGLNEGDAVTLQYTGRLKVKGVKATSEAAEAEATYTLLSAATTSDYGKVVCAAGHLHDAKTAVPDGCTAVGILGKVTETGHGLILALKNATNQTWNTINGWASASYAGTTLKVLPDDGARGTNLTSYTTLGETTVSNWAVAQKSDYDAIFTNLGSTKNSGGRTYDNNVNAYITTGVGGTAMSGTYWSATQDDDYDAWYFLASYWDNDYKTYTYYVRPVLGF